MKWIRGKCFIAICIFFLQFLYSSLSVLAEGEYEIKQIGVLGEEVVAYVEGNIEPGEISCQIGMSPSGQITVEKMEEGDFFLHTILLVDNSLSITSENNEKVNEFLNTYIQEAEEKEFITLAVFGEEISLLTEKTNDKEVLQAAVAKIEAKNQDTYLTDILYELLDTINQEEYTRIIVISDGVDNKAIGMTKDELVKKLETNHHPIYTIGHIYKSNEAQLENMFSLARMTGGKEYLLDDLEDLSSMVKELTSISQISRVKVAIPQNLMDGSSKALLFTINNGEAVRELRADIVLPFSLMETKEPETAEPIMEETVAKEETTTEIAASEAIEETTSEERETALEEKKEGSGLVTYIAGIALILAAVVLLVQQKKKKAGDKEASKPKKNRRNEKRDTPAGSVAQMDDREEEEDANETILMKTNYLLILRDENDPGIIFKYPLNDRIILGRNVDMVDIAIDYNLSVSGQHCEISQKGNRFFIRDLNSVNHTWVEQKRIQKTTEIYSGSRIRLGEVELYVEILPI